MSSAKTPRQCFLILFLRIDFHSSQLYLALATGVFPTFPDQPRATNVFPTGLLVTAPQARLWLLPTSTHSPFYPERILLLPLLPSQPEYVPKCSFSPAREVWFPAHGWQLQLYMAKRRGFPVLLTAFHHTL